MAIASLRKAGGSVMVTVPPLYLKEHGLTVGSTVELEVKGDKLTITPGKKKLILSGFHEAALAAFAIQHHLFPEKRQFLQYTTTSPIMQKRLGVAGADTH